MKIHFTKEVATNFYFGKRTKKLFLKATGNTDLYLKNKVKT